MSTMTTRKVSKTSEENKHRESRVSGTTGSPATIDEIEIKRRLALLYQVHPGLQRVIVILTCYASIVMLVIFITLVFVNQALVLIPVLVWTIDIVMDVVLVKWIRRKAIAFGRPRCSQCGQQFEGTGTLCPECAKSIHETFFTAREEYDAELKAERKDNEDTSLERDVGFNDDNGDLCGAPLDYEPWENCEYCYVSKEKGIICNYPEGPKYCPEDIESAMQEMYPEDDWGEDDHS
jgi:hypothetical protein